MAEKKVKLPVIPVDDPSLDPDRPPSKGLACQLCDLLGRDVVGRRRFGDLIAKIPQLAAE